MSQTNSHAPNVTRRSFLKSTGLLAGSAALLGGVGGSLPIMNSIAVADETGNDTSSGEQEFYGMCRPNCECSCGVILTVRDGHLVKVSAADMPNNDYKRICIKGMTHAFRIYDPDRIKYPMKRVGERGSGEWERISWEEAIQTITDNWKSVREKYGPQALMISMNTANYSLANSFMGYPVRLFNLLETSGTSNSFDNNTIVRFDQTIGFQYSFVWNNNEPASFVDTKNFFIWGANLPDSHPQSWHFIQKAKENGGKIWYIDPKFNNGVAKADEHVPLRCGSDTAIFMAMIKVIIDNDWIDKDFCSKSTVSPFLVKQDDGLFLREKDLGGEGEGFIVIDSATKEPVVLSDDIEPVLYGSYTVEGLKANTALTLLKESVADFTPAHAESLSEVPAAKIEEMAEAYALDGPSTIFTLFGTDRYYAGHHATHSIAALAGITGNIGKPGATVGQHCLPCYVTGAPINSPTGTVMNTINGPETPEVIATGKFRGEDFPVKSLYAEFSNFIGNNPDQNEWIKVMTDPDLIELFVVADYRFHDSARYADIVLPVAHWFEVDDVGSGGTHPYIMIQEKIFDPLFECKSDVEITQLLAEKMGYGEYFQQTALEYCDEALKANPDCAELKVTLDKIQKEKIVRYIGGDNEHPYIFGEGGVFPTPTGRVEFYLEQPYSVYNDPRYDPETDRLPAWEPPVEAWPENELYEKYPLVFLQDHTKWRMHTTWTHVPILRELDPEPVIYIGPADAEKRGIKRGDYVRTFNDRGEVIMKALINNGIPSGVVSCPRGWQRDQHIVEGSYQELCHRKVHPFAGNHACSDTLVEVELYEGSVE